MSIPNNQHVCFSNPQRTMQKTTISEYSTIKKSWQYKRSLEEDSWKSIRTGGRNSRGIENITQELTRTHEYIARNHIKIICMYALEDKT